jgi:hypothetical protein
MLVVCGGAGFVPSEDRLLPPLLPPLTRRGPQEAAATRLMSRSPRPTHGAKWRLDRDADRDKSLSDGDARQPVPPPAPSGSWHLIWLQRTIDGNICGDLPRALGLSPTTKSGRDEPEQGDE